MKTLSAESTAISRPGLKPHPLIFVFSSPGKEIKELRQVTCFPQLPVPSLSLSLSCLFLLSCCGSRDLLLIAFLGCRKSRRHLHRGHSQFGRSLGRNRIHCSRTGGSFSALSGFFRWLFRLVGREVCCDTRNAHCDRFSLCVTKTSDALLPSGRRINYAPG